MKRQILKQQPYSFLDLDNSYKRLSKANRQLSALIDVLHEDALKGMQGRRRKNPIDYEALLSNAATLSTEITCACGSMVVFIAEGCLRHHLKEQGLSEAQIAAHLEVGRKPCPKPERTGGGYE